MLTDTYVKIRFKYKRKVKNSTNSKKQRFGCGRLDIFTIALTMKF